MPQMSSSTSPYRDGVFSVASPAPRYGTLLTAFENGSLGGLEEDADTLLNTCLTGYLEASALTQSHVPAQAAALQVARDLAKQALETTDLDQKLVLTCAASYSAAYFGLPRNDLLPTVDQVFGMFVMPMSQRGAYHQQATALLESYVSSLKKGNSMSGVYRDGVLGSVLMRQNGAFRDGSLGLNNLMAQSVAYRDGSLGAYLVPQNVAYQDGSLGDPRLAGKRYHAARRVPMTYSQRTARAVSGTGCGCGVGADEIAVAETPFYKKPAYIAGGAVLLGVALYAATRK